MQKIVQVVGWGQSRVKVSGVYATYWQTNPLIYFKMCIPVADITKGVGRGPTLAWPGWKQPDISVKVDTARLEAGQFKKCCMECVLLYYPSTEF